MGDLYPTLISPIDLKGSDVTRAFRLCDVAVIVRVDARVGPVTRDRQYIALPSRSPDRRAFRAPPTPRQLNPRFNGSDYADYSDLLSKSFPFHGNDASRHSSASDTEPVSSPE